MGVSATGCRDRVRQTRRWPPPPRHGEPNYSWLDLERGEQLATQRTVRDFPCSPVKRSELTRYRASRTRSADLLGAITQVAGESGERAARGRRRSVLAQRASAGGL